MHALRLICAVVAVLSSVSFADADATDAVEAEELAVQAWGTGRPECTEWSDTCVVCRRGASESLCSTPGIACVPQATTCRQPVEPAKP